MIGRILALVGRHAPAVLAAGVFLGLAWPDLASALAPALVPSVFLLLALALLRLDWREVAVFARRGGTSLALVAWLLLVSPVLMWLVVEALAPPAALAAALVMMAGSSPIISAIAFAQLLRLDAALAVIAVVLSTVAVPVVLPPMALLLMGLEIEIGLAAFMARLLVLVGGAVAVAWAVRRIVGGDRIAAAGDGLDGATVVLLLVFAVAIMDGVTAAAIERPGQVALYVAAAFAANLGLQAAGAAAFSWLGRAEALTAGLATGNRNMAILLASLAGTDNFDIALFFAVGQLPIYILPMMLAPLYRRLTRTA